MSRRPFSPKNLDEWLDFFSDKSLPVRASTIVRMRKAIDSPSSNLLSLSPIIRSDPMMVFHISCAAQKLLSAKSAKVASIDHAVQALGFDRIRKLLAGLQGFKLNPTSTVHIMFMRAVADSHHASIQAAEFARLKHQHLQQEEIKLAALLYGFAHWLAWLHAPLHKEAYQRKVLQEGVDVALAEFDIFGCTLQAVGQQLAKKFELPEMTVAALSHDTSPSSDLLAKLHMKAMGDPRLKDDALREINHFFQQPFFSVKLANWLALTATRGWNSPKAKRLYEIISDYIGMDKDATLAHLHSRCAYSAREFFQPGVLSPASEMLLIPSQNSEIIGIINDAEKSKFGDQIPVVTVKAQFNKNQPNRAATNTPLATAPSHYLDQTLFDAIAAEFAALGNSKQFIKAGHIIKQLHRGLLEGLGLQRVLILQVSQKDAKLKALLSSGFTADDPFKNFTQDLNIPSIFKRLSTKATFICFSSETSQRLVPLLPTEFERIMPNNDWLLMSLFDNKGPLVMVYADNGHLAPPMNTFIIDRFRFLCTAANQALKTLS